MHPTNESKLLSKGCMIVVTRLPYGYAILNSITFIILTMKYKTWEIDLDMPRVWTPILSMLFYYFGILTRCKRHMCVMLAQSSTARIGSGVVVL